MSNHDFDALRYAVQEQKELYAIFDRIRLGNASGKLNHTHKPRVLSDESIVNDSRNLSLEDSKKEFQKLEDDFQIIKDLDSEAQTSTFFHLLQKYGWRIGDPEATGEKSASVAFCDAYRVKKALEGHDNFILLKGDLAGIQKYIYGNIQPSRTGGLAKIAKKLRGRSILVSLLTDFLANVILKEMDLPAWHLLFAGGGHFNLLIPSTNENVELLEGLPKKLNDQMRRRFDDNLQLVIAQKEFSHTKLEDAGKCFSELNTILEKQKFQQHQSSLPIHFSPPSITEMENEDWETDEDIGKKFPNRNFLIETFSTKRIKPNQSIKLFSFKLAKGIHSLFASPALSDADVLLLGASESGLKSAQIFYLNNTDFPPKPEEWDYNLKSVGFGFRFLSKTVPTIEDLNPKTNELEIRPKTFEEIVKGDENKMLAALRLDVDDLGFIFSRGMPHASLGEIVCLSREMQYFFSAHFDQLAAQKKDENGVGVEHDLYLIYSGGDDAFAVGKWDNVIHFTKKLRSDFQEFVFGNPDVHFSAGIFMGNPHYPVGRFYRDAGELQKKAKELIKNEWRNSKNRISVFNHVMEWESFASKIILGETFFDALKDKGKDAVKFNSAFVYRILNLVKSSFHERAGIDRNGNTYHRGTINMERFSRNVSGLRYLFARHGYDEKRANEKVGKLEKVLLGDFLKSFNFGSDEQVHSIRDYLVALNYAIFKNRGKPENINHKN